MENNTFNEWLKKIKNSYEKFMKESREHNDDVFDTYKSRIQKHL